MAQILYIDSIALLLLLSALVHLFMPQKTNFWMSKLVAVRLVGAILLIFSATGLHWRGLFFWTLSAALAISGIWRLCFPRHSIRTQQRIYPRWIHGCLLLTGAILVWALGP